jgi:O-antigen/teichoic acid export membrane protein
MASFARSGHLRWIGASFMAFFAAVVVGCVITFLVVVAYVDLFDDPRRPGWAVLYGGLVVVPVIALLRSIRGGRQQHLRGSALLLQVSQQLLLVGVLMFSALMTLVAFVAPF